MTRTVRRRSGHSANNRARWRWGRTIEAAARAAAAGGPTEEEVEAILALLEAAAPPTAPTARRRGADPAALAGIARDLEGDGDDQDPAAGAVVAASCDVCEKMLFVASERAEAEFRRRGDGIARAVLADLQSRRRRAEVQPFGGLVLCRRHAPQGARP